MSFDIPTLDDEGRLQNPQVLSQIRQIAQAEAKKRSGSAGGGSSVISGTGRPDIPETTGGAITAGQDGPHGAFMPVDVDPGTFYYSEDACDGAVLWVYQVDSWYGDTGFGDMEWHERPIWHVVVGAQTLYIRELEDEPDESSEEPEQSSAYLRADVYVRPDLYAMNIAISGTKKELFSEGAQRIFTIDDGDIVGMRFPEAAGVLVARNWSLDNNPFYLVPVVLNWRTISVDFTSLADVEDSEDEVWDVIGSITWPGDGDWPYERFRHLHYYPEEEEGDE